MVPDPNTDTARNQGSVIPQAAVTGLGKIDTIPDHQDYVAYLREGTCILVPPFHSVQMSLKRSSQFCWHKSWAFAET